MKERVKKGLRSFIGFERYSKLNQWLKVLRVFYNRLFSPRPRCDIHPRIHDQENHHTQLQVENAEVFFGYYDHNPISKDGKYCLAIKVSTPPVTVFNMQTLVGKEAEIGFFELGSKQKGFHSIATTDTWCWQQGARLMWWAGSSNKFIYNYLDKGKYSSIVRDLEGKVINKFEFPIYDLNGCGNKALSLNFSRLQRLRPGYGYSNLEDPYVTQLAPREDGVWLHDLQNGDGHLLFNLELLANFSSCSTMMGAEHYINHLSWSPNGSDFLFFHIWAKNGKRYTRVLTSNVDGKNLNVLVSDGASHYCWTSNTEVIIFTTIGKVSAYKKYDIKTGTSVSLDRCMPQEDGHPSKLSDRYVVTDTYPDRFGQQHILLCDLEENEMTTIGSFYSSPLTSGEVRCDLHPRVMIGSKDVCFDSNYKGRRTINIVNLKKLIDGAICKTLS